MYCGNRLFWVVALVSGLSFGCGGSSKGPALFAVQGTVNFDGKPLENAQVVFIPADATSGRSASGVTGKDGSYRLGTSVEGDGAEAGKYKVTVTARGPDKEVPPEQSPTGLPGATLPGPALIPEKYFQPDSSGLTAEVKSGSGPIDFELKSK